MGRHVSVAGATPSTWSSPAGRLCMQPGRGGPRVELRASGGDLLGDDVLATGPRLVPDGEKLRIGDEIYEREALDAPAPAARLTSSA